MEEEHDEEKEHYRNAVEDERDAYLKMEYVEGVNMDDFVKGMAKKNKHKKLAKLLL